MYYHENSAPIPRINLAAVLVVVLAVMNAFDVIATYIALARGVEEANPISRFIIDSYGFSGLIAVKSVFVGVLALTVKHIKGYLIWLLAVAVSVYSWLTIVHIGGLF